jgi:MFS family permease
MNTAPTHRATTRIVLPRLSRDMWLLFAARFIRLFAYGSLSVVLVFYLIGVGLTEPQTGLLLTLTLLGDTVVSLVIAKRADRVGRRRMLIVGAMLMIAAGLVFASTRSFWLLLVAARRAQRAPRVSPPMRVSAACSIGRNGPTS